MIRQVGRGLHHSAGIAGGTDAPAFTGEGNEKIMAAVAAADTGKSIGKDTALQIAPQFTFRVRADALLLPVVPAQGEEGLQMVLHRAVERGVRRAAWLVGGRDASQRLDGHVRVRIVAIL